MTASENCALRTFLSVWNASLPAPPSPSTSTPSDVRGCPLSASVWNASLPAPPSPSTSTPSDVRGCPLSSAAVVTSDLSRATIAAASGDSSPSSARHRHSVSGRAYVSLMSYAVLSSLCASYRKSVGKSNRQWPTANRLVT